MEVKSALCSVVARKEESRMPYTVSGCHLFSSCRGETKNTITQHDLCVCQAVTLLMKRAEWTLFTRDHKAFLRGLS